MILTSPRAVKFCNLRKKRSGSTYDCRHLSRYTLFAKLPFPSTPVSPAAVVSRADFGLNGPRRTYLITDICMTISAVADLSGGVDPRVRVVIVPNRRASQYGYKRLLSSLPVR